MRFSRRSLLIGSAAFATVAMARNAAQDRVEAARALVNGLLARDPIPAFSIAVMRGEELLWAEAFGKVDLELDVAAKTSHRFRLGSVSKVITATLAAQLAASKTVDLDAPIATYLPDLPEQHRATTLRQLLTHRGGIRHYADKDDAPGNPGPIGQRMYANNADILAVFIDDPLIAKPGERVSYSTFGYTLVSLVLESAAKTPFLALLQREIATPLGLTSLGPDDVMALVPQRVRGYHPGDLVRQAFPGFQGKWSNTRHLECQLQVGGRRVVSHAHGRGAFRRRAPGARQAFKGGTGHAVHRVHRGHGALAAAGPGLAHRYRCREAAALASRRHPGRRTRRPRGVSEGEAFDRVGDECDRIAGRRAGAERAARRRLLVLELNLDSLLRYRGLTPFAGKRGLPPFL